MTQPVDAFTSYGVVYLGDITQEGVMSDDIMEVLTKPTVDVVLAGRVLGIGRNAAYKARKAGEIPVIKIGGTYRVPTSKLREMLGLSIKGEATA